MLTCELEIGTAVIEVFNTANYRKRFIIMTFGTILSEFISMRIFVTIGAIAGLYTFEFLKLYSVF